MRRFSRLDASPEFLFGRDQHAEVEGIHGNGDLYPFAPAGDDRQRGRPQMGNPHVMLKLGHVFFGRGLLGEGPRQHKLGFEYGSYLFYGAVERCRHPGDCGMLH